MRRDRRYSWICTAKWGWCDKVKAPHKCNKTTYKAKDHDHVCKECGATRKNT